VLKEIGRNVARNGFKRLAIFSTHGGNTEVIDFVIRDIREETGLYVFNLKPVRKRSVLSEDEKTYGIHAGDVETSMLLAACPELVYMDLAPDGTPQHLKQMDTPPFLGPLNFAWLTRDIASAGVLGNAQTADAVRGVQYLSEAAEGLAGLIMKIPSFEFNP